MTSFFAESRSGGSLAKRLVAFTATAGMVMTSHGTALAMDNDQTVRSASSTQMNSIPETVYTNSYTDAKTRVTSFNENWKFSLGDTPGAKESVFDDSRWTNVNVPHDYSIDQPYTRAGEAESAYKPGGVGWYRKTFQLGKDMEGKRIFLNFDGVYMDSTVYVNGTEVAKHPYGYTPFRVDITDAAKVGAENTVSVRVNNEIPTSRWYSGSGIGRDVDLIVTDLVHVEGVTVSSTTLSASNQTKVPTDIKVRVRNSGNAEKHVTVDHTIFPKGKDAKETIGKSTSEHTVKPGELTTIDSSVEAKNPELWSTTKPTLYTVRTEVKIDGKTVDTYDTDFGYRYFAFDANTGFSLNGQKMKLKGVSMHHDQGALGSVSTRAALARQVKLLKEMGVNAIRTTHNPSARQLVDICNREGVLLIEEFFDGWTAPKNQNRNDYSRFFKEKMTTGKLVGSDANKTWAQFDLEQAIARDVNSPAIIMWSIGNEVTEGTSGVPDYNKTQQNLISWVKAQDATRPVTQGDNKTKDDKRELNSEAIAKANGVVGFNYMKGEKYASVHAQHPEWKIYGSETASAVNSRGVYNEIKSLKDAGGQQLTSYDYSAVGWGHVASEAWFDTITRDFVAGEFVWTGFDYLGEPTPWNGQAPGVAEHATWPAPKNSYFGIIDTAGLPKDTFYFYQSQWNDALHTLHILPAWNEKVVHKDAEGKVPVVVYSDADAVELFFTPEGETTATSLGKKHFTLKKTDAGYSYKVAKEQGNPTHKDLYFTWNVPFKPGTLTAKAYDSQGNEIPEKELHGRHSITTAKNATQLKADVDRLKISADGTDLAYVHVKVTDAAGHVVPDARNKVTFKVEGEGTLVGIDNGSSPDHQSFRDDNRAAHAGELVAIVQSTKTAGNITVTATADGLKTATTTITSEPVAGKASEKAIDSIRYSRHIYVKAGSKLTMPETVEVRYTDGSKENANVSWNPLSSEQLAKPGTHTVLGNVNGTDVKLFVNVIDGIAALLNYSTTTPEGSVPTLPDTRPAILPDGTISNAFFSVTWDKLTKEMFDKAGTVVVKGTANVFGKDLPVTAHVRVQTEHITIGANVAGAAMKLEQSVAQDKQSDTLEAVRDGKTEHNPNPDGNTNTSAWSNWKASQDGETTSDITFAYATQQRFGQAKIHFFQDSASARWPEANTTKIAVSEDGHTWTPVATTETIGAEKNRVKAYTYSFTPVSATYVKITVTNAEKRTKAVSQRPCTGITEIELNLAQGSFSTFDKAELGSLTVNGQKVSASVLKAKEFSTRALSAVVNAEGADNTAVTVLPAFDNKIKILMESEDNQKQDTFVINLATKGTEAPLAASDDSRDYPVENITPKASSEQAINNSKNEGPAALAFDGKENTFYHSNWKTIAPFNTLNMVMELKEPTSIEALRYLPRQAGNNNGTVTSYRVDYSDNGKDWKSAGKGTWENPNEKGWRLASFTPVTAKFFRLAPVHTAGDGDQKDKFFSAAEIRLRMPKATINIADTTVATVTMPKTVSVDRVDDEHPVLYPQLADAGFKVTVKDSDKVLTYGVDYLLEFANNTKPGMATVAIKGIEQYSGVVKHDVEILVKAPTVAGIAISTPPAKTSYTAGETFDPAGMIVTVAMSNGTEKTVDYSAQTAGDFAFTPALGTPLNVEIKDVTVSYQGKTAVQSIQVTDKAQTPPASDGPGTSDGSSTPTNNSGDGAKTGAHVSGKKLTKTSLARTGVDVTTLALLGLGIGVAGVALYRRRNA